MEPAYAERWLKVHLMVNARRGGMNPTPNANDGSNTAEIGSQSGKQGGPAQMSPGFDQDLHGMAQVRGIVFSYSPLAYQLSFF